MNTHISELHQALKQVSLVDVDSIDEEIRDKFIEHLEELESLIRARGRFQIPTEIEEPPTHLVKR